MPVDWLREFARLELSAPALVITALLPGLAVLILVAILACARPTLRALRMDPTEVRKAEG
jgi:ABC-type antimicrobial peptide transport system permease subunit